jgi:hypothetical protein
MSPSALRSQLLRLLAAHLNDLGYSFPRPIRDGRSLPEIVRVSTVRGRIAYGAAVVRADLRSPKCHERLISLSQRRTRQRSSILFFIGVAEEDQAELERLLEELEIRSGTRGGHVHVVPIALEDKPRRRAPSRAKSA